MEVGTEEGCSRNPVDKGIRDKTLWDRYYRPEAAGSDRDGSTKSGAFVTLPWLDSDLPAWNASGDQADVRGARSFLFWGTVP